MSDAKRPGQQLIDTRQTWTTCPAMPSHRKEIEELYREFCSPDEELLDVALDPDHDGYEYNQIFVAVTNDGTVIGFGAANRCGRDWLSNRLGVGAIDHQFADKNGYFNTLCVAENWRGKGVGSALVRCRLEWLRSHDVHRVFGVSWIREDGPSSKDLFKKFAFQELAHIHEYYYREKEPRRWCPDCGEPCSCDAKIYGREL